MLVEVIRLDRGSIRMVMLEMARAGYPRVSQLDGGVSVLGDAEAQAHGELEHREEQGEDAENGSSLLSPRWHADRDRGERCRSAAIVVQPSPSASATRVGA